MCWFETQKVTLHPNKAPYFLLLYAITNEKTVKLMKIDGLPSESKTSPAEARSNNSGTYTLLKCHIPLVYLTKVSHTFGIPYLILTYLWYTLLKSHIT